MSKDLKTLIRLHKHRVDEKRRSLGELLGEIAALEQKNEYLENQLSLEQQFAKSASDSVGMFFGAYAKEAVNKRREIQQTKNVFEKKIAEAQEEMRAEYNDLKVFEITLESREQIATLEVAKSEQAILDELAQETRRRLSKRF